MLTTRERPGKFTRAREDGEAAPAARGVPWLPLFLGGLLIGYLLFCHGCHGSDEDHELFVPVKKMNHSYRP
jgi:hypothetical protein